MKKRKYPLSLFISGVLTNMLFHFFWLSIPCIIIFILSIFIRSLSSIGLSILIIDLILSLIEQFRIRAAFLADSDNSDFQRFQEIMSRDGDWKKNVKDFVEGKIEDNDDNKDDE